MIAWLQRHPDWADALTGVAAAALLVIVSTEPGAREVRARLGGAGVDVAERNGCVRISPHAHNTVEDIDRALYELESRPPPDRRRPP